MFLLPLPPPVTCCADYYGGALRLLMRFAPVVQGPEAVRMHDQTAVGDREGSGARGASSFLTESPVACFLFSSLVP